MNDAFDLWDLPTASEVTLIAGWHQWADAGNVSSGLPQYLIDTLDARKIGEIQPEGFYLFQMPGTHHFFRPEIKLKEGHVELIQERANEFHYWSNGDKGLVIFLGQEPHLNVDRYCDALMDAAEELGVKRILCLGGVYGSMPYDRDREIHCVYSLPALQEELADYAVSMSNYEGGATVGVYLTHAADARVSRSSTGTRLFRPMISRSCRTLSKVYASTTISRAGTSFCCALTACSALISICLTLHSAARNWCTQWMRRSTSSTGACRI